MRPAAIVLLLALNGVLSKAAAGQCNNGQVQYANPIGEWSPPYDWFDQMLGENCLTGGNCTTGTPHADPTLEIAHAALIPKGLYAGGVLLWREKQIVDPDTCRCDISPNTYTWVWEPTAAGGVHRMQQILLSEGMCAGMTWDPLGKLVVSAGGGGPESVTYRFRPGNLNLPVTEIITGFSVLTGTPWLQVGNVEVPRYYPTLITLLKAAVYLSGTGTCAPNPIPGGAAMALGGPDLILAGQEYWELLAPLETAWSCPIVPADPLGNDPNKPAEKNSPHFEDTALTDYAEYDRPGPNYAERLLDSYPRAFVMSTGQVFIEGDVDTWGPPQPNDPGVSWVIKPRYTSSDTWKLLRGPYSNPVGTGDDSYDRYYGSSVLLHEDGTPDRLLVIGGSYDANYYAASGLSPVWVVNDTIREFVKAGVGQDPFAEGQWAEKITDAAHLQRVWLNSVVLPTGEVFIVGGSSTDDSMHFQASPSALSPVFEPVIYDPGTDSSSSGTIFCMATPTGDPNGTCSQKPIARLYHSVGVLLQDGRVLVAGGHWLGGCHPDSRLNGEIFSPPYLSESWRPVVSNVPATADFGASFQIEVERRAANSIDRVVLLRPGAVSHHQDYDQRYIELDFDLDSTSGSGSTLTDTLTVIVPASTLGPPGYYMLFAIEAEGADPTVRVPSIGEFLRIK